MPTYPVPKPALLKSFPRVNFSVLGRGPQKPHGPLLTVAPKRQGYRPVINARRVGPQMDALTVGVGEAQATFGQGIDVRRIDQATFAAVAIDVADAQVIGENKDNIGQVLGHRSSCEQGNESEKEWKERSHNQGSLKAISTCRSSVWRYGGRIRISTSGPRRWRFGALCQHRRVPRWPAGRTSRPASSDPRYGRPIASCD